MKKSNDHNMYTSKELEGDLSEDLDDDLLFAIQSWGHFTPPDDFLSCTVTQYESAVKRRYAMAWLTGILATVTLSTPLFWLIVINIKEVTKMFAIFLRASSVCMEFLVTMWSQLPEMSTGIIFALWTTLFILTVALVKVFKITLSEDLSEENAMG